VPAEHTALLARRWAEQAALCGAALAPGEGGQLVWSRGPEASELELLSYKWKASTMLVFLNSGKEPQSHCFGDFKYLVLELSTVY